MFAGLLCQETFTNSLLSPETERPLANKMRKPLSTFVTASLIGILLLVLSGFCIVAAEADFSQTNQTQQAQLDRVYVDDFSGDSGLWTLLGSAYWDSINHSLVLTEAVNGQGGVAFFHVPFRGTFTANFSYKVGDGWGGDGFTLFFYKQNYTNIGSGGSLAFSEDRAGVPGYGVEFDGWQNWAQGGPSPPEEAGDPSENHVGLIKDWYGNHIVHVDDERTEDNLWHRVSVVVGETYVGVFLDDEFILRWDGALDRAYDLFGFSGGTGSATNWHIIDNFSISPSVIEPPSTPKRPNEPGPSPKPPPISNYISISTDASSFTVGSTVNVKGLLVDKYGVQLENKTVILSYSVGDSAAWYEIGSGTTNARGEYGIQWVPAASGTFALKTEWAGNDTHAATSNSTTLSFLPYLNEQVFCVESNSTVNGLEFSDENMTLTFEVSGPSGTGGYTRVTLAKTLATDIEAIAAFVDGKTVNFTASSQGESWILAFSYTHSTHQVNIKLPTPQEITAPPMQKGAESTAVSAALPASADPKEANDAEPEPSIWLLLAALAMTVAAAVIAAAVFKKSS